MKLLDKLERKYSRFGIPNLMLYIVMLNLFVYLLELFYPDIILKLALIRTYVFECQIWRIITFMFIPPSYSFIFIVFVLYFYFMIGSSLEHIWGTFKFNIYYFMGVICTIIGSLITGYMGTSNYINLSLFLAFAALFPNNEILLFFIIPIKIKYLAWIDWAYFAFTILFGSIGFKIFAIASLINYFVFFGKDIIKNIKNNRRTHYSKKKFESNFKVIDNVPFHKCTICGKTELDDPNLQFRYCSKCNGDYEYCMEHLHNHKHIL